MTVTLVFDKVGFGWVVNNRQFLPDSYTRFKNRIGLTDLQSNFISGSGEVVLTFPYKDCVLEGGQSVEDQKRDEIFYNTVLAPDEVDRLLYPKVLVAAKKYTSSGIEENVTFEGEIKCTNYIKNKGFDDKYYKDLIVEYLKQYEKAKKKDIRELLWDKLPDVLSDTQKENKIRNILTAMKKQGIIDTDSKNQQKSNWILK